MSGRSQPQRRGARQVDAEYREAERMRCGVPVLCPRVPVMDQREPMETNEQRRAKSPTYNTSAYLRVGAGRSENPGVGGSIPSPPTNFSRTSAYSLALKYSHCFFCSAMKFVKRGLPRMLSRLVSFSNSV